MHRVNTRPGVLAAAVLLTVRVSASADPLLVLNEGFDDIGTLAAAGWVMTNNSDPLGSTGWFQGNPGVFSSHSGAPDSYIAANSTMPRSGATSATGC